MTRWFETYEAPSPDDRLSTWSVGIRRSHIEAMVKYSHVVKLARASLIKPLLEDPEMVVRGWDRADRDDCFAYVGSPAEDRRSATITTPPPKKYFVVFILPDGTIDDWGWRDADPLDASRPDGLRGEVTWTR